MPIKVALYHKTSYRYDRPISIGPQVVRLRPAHHCRTPVPSYSLKVTPKTHFVNWQQDPFGNYLARFVFPEKSNELTIEVDLVAEMTVYNPFDFFVEESAEDYPFQYDATLSRELAPFLEKIEPGPRFREWLASIDVSPRRSINFLVDINQKVSQAVNYLIRMEPGVQTPEETLTLGSGSCRDSAWLFVQTMRHLGLAARFVSGYLIQLAPDVKSLDGPSGTEVDFTDLHAWAEVYLPGAGWIGLDATSGLLAGEGHLPLACTPDPSSAAPITGAIEPCGVEFDFEMKVTRIHEDPRVTKPYTDEQWNQILELGDQLDERMNKADVRLTMGGEPTFVSIDDMESPEWNSAAVGQHKRELSETLVKRLRERFAPGGLLHFGQGKWYPGESLPRWSLACYWRPDGVPVWNNPDLIADATRPGSYTQEDASHFMKRLAERLGVSPDYVNPAYEDVAHYLLREQRLPINVDPTDPKLGNPEERARMVRTFEQGLNVPRGYILPLRRQWWQANPRSTPPQGSRPRGKWISGPWPTRANKIFLQAGDSPIGLRLPLDALPWEPPSAIVPFTPRDPFAPRGPLSPAGSALQPGVTADQSTPEEARTAAFVHHHEAGSGGEVHEQVADHRPANAVEEQASQKYLIRTAMCVELRSGHLHVFMPPVEELEDYLDLVQAVEQTCEELNVQVVIEGYHPPHDPRLKNIKVTPDPGVIEINIHPSSSWKELVETTNSLYDEARQTRLGTEKFDLDGKHTGTGGGNHIVIGGETPSDSPFLRRPDLLKSLIGFWQNHPSLSYLFSGRFIGPTSQAPRVDEGRRDSLYELQLAFSLVPPREENSPPWLVDRLFRNLLIDLTGNTHRAEICIDKLYSPDSSSGRLGLVEFRGFEMPPHPQMGLAQQLLVRACIAAFWDEPYDRPLIDWGTALHDRFMLPHFIQSDFKDVLEELKRRRINFDPAWFVPHFEFRFPVIGRTAPEGVQLELRTAIEPWYVLGEEPAGGGTVRYVDSSVERLQVKVSGLVGPRYILTANRRRLPLTPTGTPGEYVAGVRYRAWAPPGCLHPTIPVHTPLTFDLLDTWSNRSLGGCVYHVAHPGGMNYTTFPVNSYEAEARRISRFSEMGHTVGTFQIPPAEFNPGFPLTLDLRRSVSPA